MGASAVVATIDAEFAATGNGRGIVVDGAGLDAVQGEIVAKASTGGGDGTDLNAGARNGVGVGNGLSDDVVGTGGDAAGA